MFYSHKGIQSQGDGSFAVTRGRFFCGITRGRFFCVEVIKEYKEVCGYEIYAFCLMSNHIHLLIKEGKEDLGIVFRRIGSKFVYWYNWKYKRSGHLFQDR
ncbi:MAG: transposase [Tissierellales bacterium]|nr:transposase [Tissierellales bacterium]